MSPLTSSAQSHGLRTAMLEVTRVHSACSLLESEVANYRESVNATLVCVMVAGDAVSRSVTHDGVDGYCVLCNAFCGRGCECECECVCGCGCGCVYVRVVPPRLWRL